MKATDMDPPNALYRIENPDAARPADRIPPSGLDPFVCPSCGLLHPKKPTLTTSEVAYLSSYAKASIHTFHSRGGVLPKPAMNGRGNPRWSSCQVARWLHGNLPPEDIEPLREKRAS